MLDLMIDKIFATSGKCDFFNKQVTLPYAKCFCWLINEKSFLAISKQKEPLRRDIFNYSHQGPSKVFFRKLDIYNTLDLGP